MVDTSALGADAARRGGSSPLPPTKLLKISKRCTDPVRTKSLPPTKLLKISKRCTDPVRIKALPPTKLLKINKRTKPYPTIKTLVISVFRLKNPPI